MRGMPDARTGRQTVGTPYPSGYEHLRGLLFVTTDDAKARLGAQAGNPNVVKEQVEDIVDERMFFTIPDNPTNVYVAADQVVSRLRKECSDEECSIKGVVILGDYATVPSRPVVSITYDDYLRLQVEDQESNLGDDLDDWIVWNDDLYGDWDGDRLAKLPVSRIPIVPTQGGLVGEPRGEVAADATAFGVRSTEFDFADLVYGPFFAPDAMAVSPPSGANVPARWPDASPDDALTADKLMVDRLYLALHSASEPGSPFWGNGMSSGQVVEELDAIDFDVFGSDWRSPAVIFAGVCWGALVARKARSDHAPLAVRHSSNSVALAFLDHGANAVVGFTAQHYVSPDEAVEIVSGARIHLHFWNNIDLGRSPAEALYRAKASFIVGTQNQCLDPVAIAKDVKTFWSATCLGLGW